MSMIQNVAAALCGALVVTAVFSMLVPSAGINRFVQLAVRLFFLLCIAVPLVRNRVDLDLDASRYLSAGQSVQTDLNALAEAQLLEAFSENVESQVARILQKHDVAPEKIEIGVHIGEDQSIDITTIKIMLEEESGALGDALSEIQTAVGTPASVVYSRDAK